MSDKTYVITEIEAISAAVSNAVERSNKTLKAPRGTVVGGTIG